LCSPLSRLHLPPSLLETLKVQVESDLLIYALEPQVQVCLPAQLEHTSASRTTSRPTPPGSSMNSSSLCLGFFFLCLGTRCTSLRSGYVRLRLSRVMRFAGVRAGWTAPQSWHWYIKGCRRVDWSCRKKLERNALGTVMYRFTVVLERDAVLLEAIVRGCRLDCVFSFERGQRGSRPARSVALEWCSVNRLSDSYLCTRDKLNTSRRQNRCAIRATKRIHGSGKPVNRLKRTPGGPKATSKPTLNGRKPIQRPGKLTPTPRSQRN
jgi:hypothetical protein